MSGDQPISKPAHKAYGITNIKTYVPLILDLPTRNYEPWSTLFKAHCIAYGVLDYIDDTYDPPNQAPTNTEWLELDSMVTLWLFGSISQNLITSAHSKQANAIQIWLNIHSIFHDDQEATAIQYETELRNIQMGELNVHAYCDKVKKLADLLEGIGEKVKHRNLIPYALNGLSPKFESVANILRHRKPIPPFSEMRTTLSVEETRLASSAFRPSSHTNHSSSHSLLHVDSGSSN
ncbi:uncharacterized protein LOC111895134 [Lactuca sativa]|uniref:uncharacterized protein LOC111895134 n=1 Tax=Lactuca sativa TaxID=4236 RepID=UPI000CD87134|nr:uncharacterized protein LOC111895134 [Lactuca sativa]